MSLPVVRCGSSLLELRTLCDLQYVELSVLRLTFVTVNQVQINFVRSSTEYSTSAMRYLLYN